MLYKKKSDEGKLITQLTDLKDYINIIFIVKI